MDTLKFSYCYCECSYKSNVKSPSGKCHCGKWLVDVYISKEEK